MTVMRQKELQRLRISQFLNIGVNGINVWAAKGILGSIDGTAKFSKGGVRSDIIKLKHAFIFNEAGLD